MILQEFHFGIPDHGWMKFKVIGDTKCVEYDVSDVPIDPFIGIAQVIDDIGHNMNPRDLTFHLEPSELVLSYSDGSLNVKLDGKNESSFILDLHQYGYHLAMAVNRLAGQCINVDLKDHWPSKIPTF
jgi:hypothetical protein